MLRIFRLTALTLLLASVATFAQERPRFSVQLQDQERLSGAEGLVRLFMVRDGAQYLRAQIVRSDAGRRLSVSGRREVQLPYQLETLVSDDGRHVVQYGDETDDAHPSRTNLFWIDADGGVAARVSDRFAEEALVAMSGNGWTAVAGSLRDERERRVLNIYDPSGRSVWEYALPEDRRFSLLAVARQGTRTFFGTTPRTRPLADHRLHVANDKGEIVASIRDFKILQKVVVVNDGNDVFVQGYDDYGLVEADGASLRWRNDGKVRMVSPYAAKTDAAGNVLFLVLADFKGRAQPSYRWSLTALDAADGGSLQSVWLPEQHPGTLNHVFEQVSADRVRLVVGTQRLTYGWQRTREEK